MCAYLGEFSILLPELFLAGFTSILLVLATIFKNIGFRATNILTILSLVFAIVILITKVPNESLLGFKNLFRTNNLIFSLKLILLSFTTIFMLIHLGQKYESKSQLKLFEYPILVLFSLVGMMLMISSNNFITFYVSLELQSLSLYVMAAFEREHSKPSESGLKYFVLGSFASGLMLFGISYIYGFTGNTDFIYLKELLMNNTSNQLGLGLMVGVLIVIISLFFKVSAVPFHMWSPDVYQGAPTISTCYFANIAKIGSVGFLLLFLTDILSGWKNDLKPIMHFVTFLTLLIGAIGALKQTNIKRLLAYSSIGHVGFMLMGIESFTLNSSVISYLTIYVTMNLALFALIMNLKKDGKEIEEISDFSGLAQTYPMVGLAISILMFSLAGIPPFAGFFAKFYVFQNAISDKSYFIVISALFSAVISAYYYLKIVKFMFFDQAKTQLDYNVNLLTRLIISLLVLFNLFYILI